MFDAIRFCTAFGLVWALVSAFVQASSIDDRAGYHCRTSGCVTQYGCVPRYSNFRTALYCHQCVVERCPSQRAERKVCYQLTATASGQRLASRENYDRRSQLRYATIVTGRDYEAGGERDKWNLLVGPGSNYYIQNSDTGEYLRAQENNFAVLVPGRPSDSTFLFKPILVRGSWSCVMFQSVCYGSYLYGERYSASSNFVLMTQDLQRCYQESLWSVSTVYC